MKTSLHKSEIELKVLTFAWMCFSLYWERSVEHGFKGTFDSPTLQITVSEKKGLQAQLLHNSTKNKAHIVHCLKGSQKYTFHRQVDASPPK
jgi:hypothetical protein